MELVCPHCSSEIEPANVNISTDLAKCTECDEIFKASELIEKNEVYKVQYPPFDTKFEMVTKSDNSFEFYYPQRSVAVSDAFFLVFMFCWLGFLGFWTYLTSQADYVFALLSVPFWVIGITLLLGFFNSFSETQSLILNEFGLTLYKNRLLNSKTYEVDISDIQVIRMKTASFHALSIFNNFALAVRMQRSFAMGGVELPAIVTAIGTQYFFEYADDNEQAFQEKPIEFFAGYTTQSHVRNCEFLGGLVA
ncbi:MAG: hypothetical protein MI922_24055 [Bacteroidales bacterium]|nr:hypothetical protein [Bacteroidales bacterium]